ncbi:MAG: translational GTPase TypA [Anaerolineae bacterium]|uniref:translational GTPase TypA n=1 Tax=Promineifilum sp. TaxID=2664178 RepID=UPI001DF0B83F|nr:translational GTPase TypA [Anaerolineales bacterium]MCB8936654.1 translational GTPase TypA [Promineifilum sp.]MCO5181206.1 translational GTPase TypA [Promineifilum sp.]MCW5847988.1 translational GTPase TypA [Anaerolineae bacterium]
MNQRPDIRNIAIIAHVDHGKTTLVDGMLRQTNAFRQNQNVAERVLDSNDLERERGITILAKNTSIEYNGVTINIVDTPGHADFGGEVERIMNMVDGVLLLVDAVEGPMAQTRFVLRQALGKRLPVILVVNKIDRPAARPDYAVNATFDLFIDLGATEEQALFPVIYAKATEGRAGFSAAELGPNLIPLFDTILEHIPPPTIGDGPTQLLVTALEYSNYVGKIAVGRLLAGKLRAGQTIAHINSHGELTNGKVTKLYTFRDLQRQEQAEVAAGTIVAVAGIPDVGIGDTLADPDDPRALPPIKVEEPTVRMVFRINDSPFAGREGKYVTSRQLHDRLMRELESNVALRVEDMDKATSFLVSGRGELHLAILIETMRREGYEFAVGRPEVIFREGDAGERLEPFEQVFVEALNDHWGSVAEMLGRRRGRLLDIRYGEDGTVYGEYSVPTRGVLGFRQPFLTATRGTGVYHTLFDAYLPYAGDIDHTEFGSLVSLETGPVSGYALEHLTARGTFFVRPSIDEVYAGQVVGEHIRDEDLVINVCRTKNLTGHRAKPTAIVEALSPPRILSLDEAIEYLHEDELLEVTPESLRIRKMVLDHNMRNREAKRVKYAEN